MNRSNAIPESASPAAWRASGSSRPRIVDEKVDGARSRKLPEHFRDALEAQQGLVLVVELGGVGESPLEHRDEQSGVCVDELFVSGASRALGVEQRRQRRDEVTLWHLVHRYLPPSVAATVAVAEPDRRGLPCYAKDRAVGRPLLSILPLPLGLTAAMSLGAPVAPAPPPAAVARSTPAGQSPLEPAPCPAGTLPDGNACVHLPGGDSEGPDAESESGGHHDRRGHWVVYDQIPRRPDRPADYDVYRYPVPCEHGCVVSGYDLDQPDDRSGAAGG